MNHQINKQIKPYIDRDDPDLLSPLAYKTNLSTTMCSILNTYCLSRKEDLLRDQGWLFDKLAYRKYAEVYSTYFTELAFYKHES